MGVPSSTGTIQRAGTEVGAGNVGITPFWSVVIRAARLDRAGLTGALTSSPGAVATADSSSAVIGSWSTVPLVLTVAVTTVPSAR